MSRLISTARVGACIGSLLTIAVPQAAACDDRQPVHVAATRAPLAAVIDDIATRCSIEVVSNADLSEPVSFDYSKWSAAETLRRLLRSHSYVLESDANGRPLRLRILGSEKTQRLRAIDPLSRIRLDITDTDPDVRIDAVLALVELDASRRDELSLLLETARLDSNASVRQAAAAVLDELQTGE